MASHSPFVGRLWVPAPDAVSLTAVHELSQGWRLAIAHRHSGEDWDHCPVDRYGYLTGSEALDVSSVVLWELLGSASESPAL